MLHFDDIPAAVEREHEEEGGDEEDVVMVQSEHEDNVDVISANEGI